MDNGAELVAIDASHGVLFDPQSPQFRSDEYEKHAKQLESN